MINEQWSLDSYQVSSALDKSSTECIGSKIEALQSHIVVSLEELERVSNTAQELVLLLAELLSSINKKKTEVT